MSIIIIINDIVYLIFTNSIHKSIFLGKQQNSFDSFINTNKYFFFIRTIKIKLSFIYILYTNRFSFVCSYVYHMEFFLSFCCYFLSVTPSLLFFFNSIFQEKERYNAINFFSKYKSIVQVRINMILVVTTCISCFSFSYKDILILF